MEEERFFLYDEKEKSDTRFVSFMGETHRHDLALVKTSRYYGKTLVLDIQGNRFGIIGHDDIEEPGYLEHAFNLTEVDAEELREFLREAI
ncbi:hypothetical protein GCM10007216_10070 [Thalassobacillus devorans]|uniref:Cytosolic protein n=1 Tax=Thalassobacillus devorans TaxID=279813 RepID=A0ABQ1NNF5_9BACI|nr:DUF3055 domain-containing protein [Thalassobacillus devorans]NIK29054.1 hypothetical protein [Thalassobacillus devorans]GGC81516.1 hypothetical protein GCM10007216_10070 [Thalassobacillus devorans]